MADQRKDNNTSTDINKLQLSSDEIHKGRSGIRYTMDIKVKNTTKGTLIGVSTQGQGSIEEKNHSLSIILSLYSKVPKIMYYFSIVALVSMIAYYFIFTEETKILHIVLFAFLILFNQNYGSYIEQEELMVIKDLGMQINKVYVNGSRSNLFFDIAKIRSLVINEWMTPYNVYFYLALIIDKYPKLVLPFYDFKIKFAEIKIIYKLVNKSINS